MSDPRTSIPGRVAYTAGSVKVLVEAGVVRPMRPDRLAGVLQTLARWGRSAAAGTITLAARYPDDTAIIDELGPLSYSELHVRTNALAHSLADLGIGEGDGVAIMCRNHRGFIETTVALSKLGADALYLNTRIERGFASKRDLFTVDVDFVATRAGARELRRGLRDAGYAARIERVHKRAYRFGVRRNPRTLAGITRDGRLLLVAIDGRRPGYSAGASFTESAGVLRALGAADGVNLDGGGSTSLTVGSSLVNWPSDTTGERPIGDALVLLGSP